MFRLRLLITHVVYLNLKKKNEHRNQVHVRNLWQIKVITKLPNSEQSYKGKVKTHNYINRQNQSTTYYNQYDLYSSTGSVETKCIFDCLHFSRWQYLLFGNIRHFFLHFLHNYIHYYLIFQNLISGTFISFGVGSLFARWTFLFIIRMNCNCIMLLDTYIHLK